MEKKIKSSVIIPARYKSSRFPGKPLASILGKPMILWVAELCAKAVNKESVFVATDDERILNSVKKFGGQSLMTSSEHKTGTDRIVEALSGRGCDWVLNIQGDEPLISSSDLERLIYKAKNSKDINHKLQGNF